MWSTSKDFSVSKFLGKFERFPCQSFRWCWQFWFRVSERAKPDLFTFSVMRTLHKLLSFKNSTFWSVWKQNQNNCVTYLEPVLSLKYDFKLTIKRIERCPWFLSLVFDANSRSSHQRCSIKKAVFKKLQYSQENTCVGLSFNNVAGLGVQLNYNEIPTQVFPFEYYKIFKNTYFEHLRMAASK